MKGRKKQSTRTERQRDRETERQRVREINPYGNT